MEKLRPAAKELRYLLARGYPRKSGVEFVGNHHQLTRDERNILFRGVFSRKEAVAIRRKKVGARGIAGSELYIDGYNITITVENAMKDRILLKGNDGVIRDISGTFRGFRQSEITRDSWGIILGFLKRYAPKIVVVYLDKPYSKSALLAASIRKWLDGAGVPGEVRLTDKVDSLMRRTKGIRATSDSSILIRGGPFFDLSGHVATRLLKRRPLIVP